MEMPFQWGERMISVLSSCLISDSCNWEAVMLPWTRWYMTPFKALLQLTVEEVEDNPDMVSQSWR